MADKLSKDKKKKKKDARKDSMQQTIGELVMATMAEPEVFDLTLPAPRIHRPPRHVPMTFGRCMKKFLVFLLSYVGITLIVVAYSIMGGFVFVALESPNEETVTIKVSKFRQKHLRNLSDALGNMLETMNISKKENWTIHADKVLLQFQSDIYELVTKDGWSGDDITMTDPKWTFAGGLLYSVTVITTIGNYFNLVFM